MLLEKGNRGHRRALGRRLLLCQREAHPDREPRGRIPATTLGLDPSGALRVRYDDGREEALVAGEVVEVK